MRCPSQLLPLVILLSLAAAIPARADDATVSGGTLEGRVVDAESGEPLFYCNVILDSLGIGTITDKHGNFVLRNIEPGTYRVAVTRIGHAPYYRQFTIAAGGRLTLTIELETTLLEADPVVVTATRKPQTTRMAPASVISMSGADIDNRQLTTFDRALESVPGLEAYRSTGISVQSISVRGASEVAGGGVGNRVLLLVDGRPALTSDSGGAFWSLVPLALIDRVEVVKGAFSSLYGSTAMGGVVNVITRQPSYEAAASLDFKFGFFEKPPKDIRYTEDALLQSEVTASYSGRNRWAGYLLQASRKQSDGHAENTAFEFYDVFAKLLFDLEENRDIEVTVGGGNARSDYPHSWLNSARPLEVRDKYTDDRQEKNHFSADVLYRALAGSSVKYSSRFYWFHHEQNSFFNESDPDRLLPGNELFGTKTNVDGNKIGNISQLDVYFGDRADLIFGADLQLDNVESSPDSIMYGNQQINNTALFAQSDVKLRSDVTATLGARYDWNHLVGGKTLSQLSPKLALVWTPTRVVSVRALYGQAFRAPTIAELFFKKEIAGGVDFVPNPDVTAERMTLSAEAGVRWSPWSPLTVDVAAYRYEYEDMIFWENVSDELGVDYPIFQVRNLNSAVMQGAELSLKSVWRNALALSANYAYLDARDLSSGRDDETLPYRPKHSAKFGADVFWKQANFHGDVRYRSNIPEVFLFPLQSPDAFWVANAGVRYRVWRNVTASVKINNVFDAQYEELARYRMPGRNWLFGLTLDL